jgi:hypothetical protein
MATRVAAVEDHAVQGKAAFGRCARSFGDTPGSANECGIDMITLAFALASSGAVAALTFGAVQWPATAQTQPAAAVVTAAPTPEWSFQVDTPTLNQNVNAWAGSQAGVQTPFGTARLRNLAAEIGENQLTVRGAADAGWFSVPVDAVATAAVQNGNVQVHVTQAHVNGVDVPQAARDQVEQQWQEQITQSIAGYRVVVRSVRLADGKLVIAGTWS